MKNADAWPTEISFLCFAPCSLWYNSCVGVGLGTRVIAHLAAVADPT